MTISVIKVGFWHKDELQSLKFFAKVSELTLDLVPSESNMAVFLALHSLLQDPS